jgi:hypothetical protein
VDKSVNKISEKARMVRPYFCFISMATNQMEIIFIYNQ